LLNIRGHLATVHIAGMAPFSDGAWTVLTVLPRFVGVLVMLSIWRALIPAGAAPSGYSLQILLTYTFAGALFAPQLNIRTQVTAGIASGAIANRFTWPMPIATQYAAEMVGEWAPHLICVAAPLLLLAPLLGVAVAPAGAAAAGFPLSLLLAITAGTALDMIWAALTVGADLGPRVIESTRAVVHAVCAGGWVPLAMYPFHLGAALAWLPFAALASAPLQIYAGTGDALPLLARQVGWAVVLSLVAAASWRRLRERMVLYGG